MAFAEELVADYADAAEFYVAEEGTRADIAALLAHPQPGIDLLVLSGRGDKDLEEVLSL